ncbi:MAG: DUF1735 domain-containing protein [Bacteroides sp.]|jgi:hypothetical protein|uniref:DUF1735 and LamG domain-containing protein n=1 Tax=Bacteroides xylanisolvens TaxID=371601 RepID=A0A921LFA0_9BACE|nr:DUF1735 and LamG domain-containing protein [Bacteroides xylanisolvens]MBE5694631.1 DUF1735 domain-containing protein [Bacteroides sp.]MDB0715523.1 DUF1735 and LamG domain-containing protein [Bacteroides xylanisolvens]MDB0739112.1 DUF1735 and LamG domain-containing protein [Bacteroides xylanisolvens]HJG11092.1 DUF1735 and LamG domain-containing protein [Bacteroides xylanisolvens]
MKAKYLLLTMFWVGILSACTNAETFKDALYFTGTEDSPTVKYTVDGPSEIGVTISASCLAMNDQVVTVKVDSNKLAGYNTLYGKKYKMVPVDDYMLSGNELVLKTGQNISEQLIFSLLRTTNFEEGATYCVPLTITNVTGGMSVLESSRTIYLVLNQVMIVNAAKSVNMPLTFQDDPSLASVPQVTMEARVMVAKFASSSPYISTVMGVEEEFLLRFGDTTIKPNQIQLAGGGFPVTGKTEFEVDKWYHLAVVFDGSTIKLYVNGELDGQVDAPRSPIVLCGKTDKRRFCIGGSLNSRLLNGYISEVRVWKKALTQNEIQNNMCYISPDYYQDMVAYWRFNEGEGSVIKDWTGNGWDINKTLTWKEGVRCPE